MEKKQRKRQKVKEPVIKRCTACGAMNPPLSKKHVAEGGLIFKIYYCRKHYPYT